MLIRKKLLVYLLPLLLLISCEKDQDQVKLEFLSFSVSNQYGKSVIDNQNSNITTKINSAGNISSLVATFTVTSGATVWVGDILQTSGLTVNDFSTTITYTIQSPDGISEKNYAISIITVRQLEEWGLGINLTDEKSNDKIYEWYYDQYGSGQHQYINCGPTSVAMAIKWADPTSTVTPQDARNTYKPEGGWWYTTDIARYLTDHNIAYSYHNYDHATTSVKTKLDAGNIVILCLDMYYIRYEANSQQRVDKFYNASTTGWGHFIVVKGYKIVDGTLFFEVNDPYSLNQTYYDGTYKGKNRYYRNTDLFTATQIWWKYLIVVQPKGKKYAPEGALNAKDVPAAYGGLELFQ